MNFNRIMRTVNITDVLSKKGQLSVLTSLVRHRTGCQNAYLAQLEPAKAANIQIV